MTRPSTQAGFTLIETLVALAIVGLSMTVMLRVISDNLDRTRRAQDEAVATSLVQSLLTQAESGTPRPGLSSGRFNEGYSWRLQVASYAGVHGDWPVDAVTIAATVSWHEDGIAQSRTLTTLRVIPKVSP